MNDRNASYLTMSILLILMSSAISPPVADLPNVSSSRHASTSLSQNWSYVPSDNIRIFGDYQMEHAGFPGSGTKIDPFRISGLLISSLTIGIFIEEVSYHFVIANCIITSPTHIWDNYSGVSIEASIHASVVNTTISWKRGGIDIDSCYGAVIENNTIENCWGTAIRVWDSDGTVIRRNSVSNTTSDGISTVNSEDVDIASNTITYCQGIPIYCSDCSQSTIRQNIISNSEQGIHLRYANDVRVTNNQMEHGGIYTHWVGFGHSLTLNGNTVGGQPIGFFKDEEAKKIDGVDYGQIILFNCSEVTISGGHFTNVSCGVSALWCHDSSISNITCQGASRYGLSLRSCRNVTVENCVLTNSSSANIYIEGGRNCRVQDSMLEEGEDGIYLTSNGCTVTNCTIRAHKNVGLRSRGQGTNITANVFMDNQNGGLTMSIDRYHENVTRVMSNQFVNDGLARFWNLYPGRVSFYNNTVNGRLLRVIMDEDDIEVYASNLGQLFIVNSRRVHVSFGRFFNTTIGILMYGCSDCSVNQSEFKNNRLSGVYVGQGAGIRLVGNSFEGNDIGLEAIYSEVIIARNNTLINNSRAGMKIDRCSNYGIFSNNFTGCGLLVGETSDALKTGDIVSDNTVNGKQLVVLRGIEDIKIKLENPGQLILSKCSNLTIANLSFEVASGVRLLECTNCVIRSVTSEHQGDSGILLSGCSSCVIEDCLFRNNDGDGIRIAFSDNCVVKNSTAAYNRGNGVSFYDVHNCDITSCFIDYNAESGIYLYRTGDYEIIDNEVLNNSHFGLHLEYFAGYEWERNFVWENRFGWNHPRNAQMYGFGYLGWVFEEGKGNYWSDYDGESIYLIPLGNYTDPHAKQLKNMTQFMPKIASHQVFMEDSGMKSRIIWETNDTNPSYYELYLNQELHIKKKWHGGTISEVIENVPISIYTVTLIVYDTTWHSDSDSFIITMRPQPFAWLFRLESVIFVGLVVVQVAIALFIWRNRLEEQNAIK
ncbi:right-handed parallel beta-helix repeat-containing protein [Candidatus Thorarchaeota archaeon]|nr:MAG: right-handed parallel beta-helix repeat-containing protein [Candidatus Thorarchaeota archaeon]